MPTNRPLGAAALLPNPGRSVKDSYNARHGAIIRGALIA